MLQFSIFSSDFFPEPEPALIVPKKIQRGGMPGIDLVGALKSRMKVKVDSDNDDEPAPGTNVHQFWFRCDISFSV